MHSLLHGYFVLNRFACRNYNYKLLLMFIDSKKNTNKTGVAECFLNAVVKNRYTFLQNMLILQQNCIIGLMIYEFDMVFV